MRLSLDAVLRRTFDLDEIARDRTDTWIDDHLQAATWPMTEADLLGRVATAVVQALKPPLNLDQVDATTDLRVKLAELRRQAKARPGITLGRPVTAR